MTRDAQHLRILAVALGTTAAQLREEGRRDDARRAMARLRAVQEDARLDPIRPRSARSPLTMQGRVLQVLEDGEFHTVIDIAKRTALSLDRTWATMSNLKRCGHRIVKRGAHGVRAYAIVKEEAA